MLIQLLFLPLSVALAVERAEKVSDLCSYLTPGSNVWNKICRSNGHQSEGYRLTNLECEISNNKELSQRLKENWSLNPKYVSVSLDNEPFPDLTDYTKVAESYICNDEKCRRETQKIQNKFRMKGNIPPLVIPPSFQRQADHYRWREVQEKARQAGIPVMNVVKAHNRGLLGSIPLDQQLRSIEIYHQRQEILKREKQNASVTPVRNAKIGKEASFKHTLPGTTQLRGCSSVHDSHRRYLSLCKSCSVTRTLPKEYFPTYVNEAVCSESQDGCLRLKANVIGNDKLIFGSCQQHYLEQPILKNMGTQHCPKWKKVTVSLRMGCSCSLKSHSSPSRFPKQAFVRFLNSISYSRTLGD